MLQLSKSFTEIPILSLRLGGPIGTAHTPIINPTNLKIEGWRASSNRQKGDFILLSQDVREVLPQGLAVNDTDALAEPEDLIRHQELIRMNFSLLGYQVFTEKKKKLGKVSDFATDSSSFLIKKLYTQASIMKSLKGGDLAIDRNQIVEITARKIVVKDPLQKTPVHQPFPQKPPTGPAPSPAHPIQ